jgi:hypothetical protein
MLTYVSVPLRIIAHDRTNYLDKLKIKRASDGADAADGIFARRANPDNSASGAAFASEGNVNAERPKIRSAPDGKGRGFFGHAVLSPVWAAASNRFPMRER